MKRWTEKKLNAKVIVLYILSLITAFYTILTMYNSYTYISDLVNNKGLIISEELISVISYCMNMSMPYIFYTIAIWGIGYIIYRLDNLKTENEEDKIQISDIENCINLEDEDELDSFIDELKNNN